MALKVRSIVSSFEVSEHLCRPGPTIRRIGKRLEGLVSFSPLLSGSWPKIVKLIGYREYEWKIIGIVSCFGGLCEE